MSIAELNGAPSWSSFSARRALHHSYPRVLCTLPSLARIKIPRWRPVEINDQHLQSHGKIGDCERPTAHNAAKPRKRAARGTAYLDYPHFLLPPPSTYSPVVNFPPAQHNIFFRNQSFSTKGYILSDSCKGNFAVNSQPYGHWSDWSECSVGEGQGTMSRTRECIVDECPEPGEYLDFMRCFVKPSKCEFPPTSGTR